MSKPRNIPQHVGRVSTPSYVHIGGGHLLYVRRFRRIVGKLALNRADWPASRPLPSDGRNVRRVAKQMIQAGVNRIARGTF